MVASLVVLSSNCHKNELWKDFNYFQGNDDDEASWRKKKTAEIVVDVDDDDDDDDDDDVDDDERQQILRDLYQLDMQNEGDVARRWVDVTRVTTFQLWWHISTQSRLYSSWS